MVAPDQPDNFDKRLDWDGQIPASARWALNPPDAAIPQNPDWRSQLAALNQAGRDASACVGPQLLAERGVGRVSSAEELAFLQAPGSRF